MFLAKRKKDLFSDVPLDTLQDLTRILFIDDEDRSDVISYLSREKWHCRQLRDVDSLENAEIKDSHIICIDIRPFCGKPFDLSEAQGPRIHEAKARIRPSSSAELDSIQKQGEIIEVITDSDNRILPYRGKKRKGLLRWGSCDTVFYFLIHPTVLGHQII